MTRAPKLTEDQRKIAADRYSDGESIAELAEQYGVSGNTIRNACRQFGANRSGTPITKSGKIIAFQKRVRSVLWNADKGLKKERYYKWTKKVAELESKAGGSMERGKAIVVASKDYPCLERIFLEYDMSDFDPSVVKPAPHVSVFKLPPKTVHHPAIGGDSAESPKTTQAHGEAVKCDGVQQSYRENLSWAMAAAGERLRTGAKPSACPNDAAWYLYIQAVDSPKEFLQRIGQIEVKERLGGLLNYYHRRAA